MGAVTEGRSQLASTTEGKRRVESESSVFVFRIAVVCVHF